MNLRLRPRSAWSTVVTTRRVKGTAGPAGSAYLESLLVDYSNAVDCCKSGGDQCSGTTQSIDRTELDKRNRYRFTLALQVEASPLEPSSPRFAAERLGSDEDLASTCGGCQAGRDVDWIAQRGEFNVRRITDGPNERDAGVHSGPERHSRRVR